MDMDMQDVYNSWKYWKSPGILLVFLDNFYNFNISAVII